MNQTNIRSLANFPAAPNLHRVRYITITTQVELYPKTSLQLELNDNKLNGAELKHLAKYKQLMVLKYANNLVKDYADVEALVCLSNI